MEDGGDWKKRGKNGGKLGRVGVQRSTKENQTATVYWTLTRLSVWLHYYYDIYLIETKGQKSGKLLPIHLPPAEAGQKRKRYHVA